MTRRTMFFGGILFQLLAIFGLFVPHAWLVSTGTIVRLKTEPVDPYSLFRGTYVTLNYEAGEDLPIKWNGTEPLFVILEEGEDGFHERVAFSETKPELKPGQTCLRGEGWYGRMNFPDISQYFVEEGRGRDLEQERNAHRLYVDVAVNEDCKALIRGVVLGPEVPLSAPDANGRVPPRPVPISR